MQISLPPELEKFVQDEVESGHYPTPDAVVVDAVARLQSDQPVWTIEKLREELDRGVESLERGEGLTLDENGLRAFGEEIKARGRERLSAKTSH